MTKRKVKRLLKAFYERVDLIGRGRIFTVRMQGARHTLDISSGKMEKEFSDSDWVRIASHFVKDNLNQYGASLGEPSVRDDGWYHTTITLPVGNRFKLAYRRWKKERERKQFINRKRRERKCSK